MREVVKETICCCVLIEDGVEGPCRLGTNGPDEPFCNVCAERHHDVARVLSGHIIVTQRLPELAS